MKQRHNFTGHNRKVINLRIEYEKRKGDYDIDPDTVAIALSDKIRKRRFWISKIHVSHVSRFNSVENL